MRTACKLAAWVCVAVIVLLSLLPAEGMARTGADGRVEHAIAYAGTAFFVGMGYWSDRRWPALVGLLIALAGSMELLQHVSPGRHPGLPDFAASSLGAVIGLMVAWQAAARIGPLGGFKA